MISSSSSSMIGKDKGMTCIPMQTHDDHGGYYYYPTATAAAASSSSSRSSHHSSHSHGITCIGMVERMVWNDCDYCCCFMRM